MIASFACLSRDHEPHAFRHQRIAHLARIEISAGEARGVHAKLERASSRWSTSCAAVDTTGVAPMSHPQDVMQRLREDA